jgi:hypothetical protein
MAKKVLIPLAIAFLVATLMYACLEQLPSTPSVPDSKKTSANVYSTDPYTFGENILNELKKRGNALDYSSNSYEDQQEGNFVRKNGIYVSKNTKNKNAMFLVYKIPADFTKENYAKLKADYVDILNAEYDKFKNEYGAINMNIHDVPGDETKKNGFLFYDVEKKDLYLDKTDGI